MNRILAGVLLLVLTATLSHVLGYRRGVHQERQAHAAQRGAELAAALDRVATAGQALQALGAQIRDAIATSHETERVIVQTVTEVIHAHPDFAAVQRPAELDRLRRAQLQAIADAAAATELPR